MINFTICSEITEHFLGANFDMNNKSATFIDKIKCISNSQYQFKLSSKLSVNSVEIKTSPQFRFLNLKIYTR